MSRPTDPCDFPDADVDPRWSLTAEAYDPLRENSRESRFSISNGFLGVRGARSITRGERWVSPPSTYVAGLFDTAAGANVPGLVPAPDWLQVRLCVGNGPLTEEPGDILGERATLDMARGQLLGDCRVLGPPGLSLRLRGLRLVSLHDRALGLQKVGLDIESGEVDLTLAASFAGLDLGLTVERLEQDLGVWRTRTSAKRLAMASAARLWIDGVEAPPDRPGPFQWSWTWRTRPGQSIRFERLAAVVRGDTQGTDTGGQAREALSRAVGRGWNGVVGDHQAGWAERWHAADVQIEGDPEAQQALRFAGYQLIGAANPADERVSIGARGLTGDDYLGHVFWDTEIFLMPFYCLTWPEAARGLLMYRFHTLDAARANAASKGWRGAQFAWESASTGAETTPEQVVGANREVVQIRTGRQEQHITADVAYAVWQYWLATGDETFLLEAGAEILLEAARFWSSRAKLEADGRRHIRQVIGPDEYHEDVDDNAYTNLMARWCLRRGVAVAVLLHADWPDRWAELSARLALEDGELTEWTEAAETLATGWDETRGLYEQFAGYFALEDIDLTAYADRSGPMDMVLGRERIAHSQVLKQADVLAALALLPDAFPGEAGDKAFDYYEPRCGHGSSLSPAMHAITAARLGRMDAALDYFRRGAATDLSDSHAAIDGGIHIAAQGGVWMSAVFGFAGLTLSEEGPRLSPRLPASWTSLSFRLRWRGRTLRLTIDQGGARLMARLESGDRMVLFVHGQARQLSRGDSDPADGLVSAAQ